MTKPTFGLSTQAYVGLKATISQAKGWNFTTHPFYYRFFFAFYLCLFNNTANVSIGFFALVTFGFVQLSIPVHAQQKLIMLCMRDIKIKNQ